MQRRSQADSAQIEEPESRLQTPPDWILEGAGYEVVTERFERNSGQYSARLRWAGKGRPLSRGFLTHRLDPALVAGKRVRLSGYLKKSKARSPNGLWIRASVGGTCHAYNDMLCHRFSGGSRFKRYAIEVDIPPDADDVSFGIGVWEGTLWVDDLDVEIVGNADPTKHSNIPHWRKSDFHNSGGVPDRYEMGVDRTVSYSGGKSAFIRSVGKLGRLDCANFFQHAEVPEDCRERYIRLVGYVKGFAIVCLGIETWEDTVAGDWQQLAYDIEIERRQHEHPFTVGRCMGEWNTKYLEYADWHTGEWVRLEVPVYVRKNIDAITYGLWMVNHGEAWVDNLSFEVERPQGLVRPGFLRRPGTGEPGF
ncbi:MAG: hypothetical protein JXB04_13190 [Kiritimatiellae bacterium]|nr:hypothetical protein [Kiritimatiellia bacterium]